MCIYDDIKSLECTLSVHFPLPIHPKRLLEDRTPTIIGRIKVSTNGRTWEPPECELVAPGELLVVEVPLDPFDVFVAVVVLVKTPN